ncbi:MAG: HIG1 domain-containing protein [Rickettsiaceae bacterium]|nr:HIG1 domain-containing protein [Rickettsiaceae bacterium]
MLLIILFTILTATMLLIGVVSMGVGREFNKKHATKLMFLRVFFQASTIITLLLLYTGNI